jgi:hypothetical protein
MTDLEAALADLTDVELTALAHASYDLGEQRRGDGHARLALFYGSLAAAAANARDARASVLRLLADDLAGRAEQVPDDGPDAV